MCVVFDPSLVKETDLLDPILNDGDFDRIESHIRSVIGSLSMILLAKSLDLTCSLPHVEIYIPCWMYSPRPSGVSNAIKRELRMLDVPKISTIHKRGTIRRRRFAKEVWLETCYYGRRYVKESLFSFLYLPPSNNQDLERNGNVLIKSPRPRSSKLYTSEMSMPHFT